MVDIAQSFSGRISPKNWKIPPCKMSTLQRLLAIGTCDNAGIEGQRHQDTWIGCGRALSPSPMHHIVLHSHAFDNTQKSSAGGYICCLEVSEPRDTNNEKPDVGGFKLTLSSFHQRLKLFLGHIPATCPYILFRSQGSLDVIV